MDFDPSRARRTPEEIAAERAESARARAKGKQQFKAIRAYLLDVLTDPECPIDAELFRTLAFAGVYFPDLKGPIEKVVAIYSEPKQRDLRDGILLGAAIQILNVLIAE